MIPTIIFCKSINYRGSEKISDWQGFGGSTNGDFPGGSDGKESVYNAGDPGSIPGSGSSLGEGKGNPLQYSCLENPMDGGAWCPWGHKESDTTERLHSLTAGSTGIFRASELIWVIL